ncbi:MAG: MoxR family ATPase [Actinomyces sp.]|jgi:putative methanol dehydrogenase regulatory protein|uniref:AAA family ATPase n=1 Tax=Actinomyces TaxID=1654 RepID=UPI0009309523|nr:MULTISPECIES: MoxR family ATPase [Actinomyces]MDU1430740.1 MoxR family ATPase [Actinomyces sp.]
MSTYLTDDELKRSKELLDRIQKIFAQRVVGQEQLRETLIVGLLAQGHILMESVPGLAKTTAAQTIAMAISGSFHRIQCTPDLMPNDIVGTRIWNQAQNEMTTELGPVHANIVLLDEINRSSAKTQSAMLEAMQEGQTTIGGTVYPLPKPFMVMATQNPIEEEGTYVLPEAQMDRFLMKEIITYPQPLEELEVLNRIDSGSMDKPIDAEPITLEELTFLQQMTRRIFLHDTLKAYIVDLINTTRGMGPNPLPGFSQHVRVGASPRGGIALMRVSQAVALMQGRNYVMPEDIKKLRHPILRHRIIRTFDAMADDISVDGLIDAVFSAVAVP